METLEDEAVPDALLDWLEEHVSVPCGPISAPREDADDDASRFKLQVPHEVQAADDGSKDWAVAAAASLAHNGFCVLRTPAMVSAETCTACAATAARRLETLFTCARQLGLRPRHDILRFTEVCSRTPGGMRYDQRLWSASTGAPLVPEVQEQPESMVDAVPTCWVELQAAVESRMRPILAEYVYELSSGSSQTGGPYDGLYEGLYCSSGDAAALRVDSLGCVTSLPGAPDQHFHPDGTAVGLVNVFVPLVPVTHATGPTELRPGTHVWRETIMGREPRWDEGRTPTVAAELAEPGGSLLLFDYRCYHRGRANLSGADRHVGYVVFSTRPEVADAHNFPQESLVREARAAAAAGSGSCAWGWAKEVDGECAWDVRGTRSGRKSSGSSSPTSSIYHGAGAV